MPNEPRIGFYFDEEERELSQWLESAGAMPESQLTPARKRELEAMARATINDERAKISLRVPKGDLTRLKSRAMQEACPTRR